MAAADVQTLTEYLLEQEDDELEEVLLQYMADEQDLRVQEQLNRTRLDLSSLSDERLVAMPPSHSIMNAGSLLY